MLDVVPPIVVHTPFFDGLDNAHPGLSAAAGAAKSLRAIVDVEWPRKAQMLIPPADVTADPHLPERLL